MKTYIYSLILVAVLAALVEMLLPDGQEGRMSGHIRLITGMCILLALLPPLRQGVLFLGDLADGSYELTLPDGAEAQGEAGYESVFDGYLSDISRKQTEAWAYEVLSEVFGISKENVRVTVTASAGEGNVPVLENIHVVLSGKAILKNPHEIEAYIAARLGCPCDVSVGSTEED